MSSGVERDAGTISSCDATSIHVWMDVLMVVTVAAQLTFAKGPENEAASRNVTFDFGTKYAQDAEPLKQSIPVDFTALDRRF